jgi:hypothetical protein
LAVKFGGAFDLDPNIATTIEVDIIRVWLSRAVEYLDVLSQTKGAASAGEAYAANPKFAARERDQQASIIPN